MCGQKSKKKQRQQGLDPNECTNRKIANVVLERNLIRFSRVANRFVFVGRIAPCKQDQKIGPRQSNVNFTTKKLKTENRKQEQNHHNNQGTGLCHNNFGAAGVVVQKLGDVKHVVLDL